MIDVDVKQAVVAPVPNSNDETITLHFEFHGETAQAHNALERILGSFHKPRPNHDVRIFTEVNPTLPHGHFAAMIQITAEKQVEVVAPPSPSLPPGVIAINVPQNTTNSVETAINVPQNTTNSVETATAAPQTITVVDVPHTPTEEEAADIGRPNHTSTAAECDDAVVSSMLPDSGAEAFPVHAQQA